MGFAWFSLNCLKGSKVANIRSRQTTPTNQTLKPQKMPNVSLIRSRTNVRGQKPLCTILRQIRRGNYQTRIAALRREVNSGRPRTDLIESQLPHFTPAARFQAFCQLEYLVHYTGILRTDVRTSEQEVINLRQLAQKIPYVYACFLNARGNALTILTQSSNEVTQHWSAAKAVAEYYRRRLKCRSGVRAYGITEVCAFSHDPVAYFQPEAEVYPYQPAPGEKMLHITNIGTALQKKHA